MGPRNRWISRLRKFAHDSMVPLCIAALVFSSSNKPWKEIEIVNQKKLLLNMWNQIPFTGTIPSSSFFTDRDVELSVLKLMNGMTTSNPLVEDLALFCTVQSDRSSLLRLAKKQPEHITTWTLYLEETKPGR